MNVGKSMDWPFFDQILDGTLHVLVFHRRADPLFIIHLTIYRSLIIMLAFLNKYVDLSVFFRTELSFKFCPDAKCYIQSEAAGWRRGHPRDFIGHLLVLLIDIDYNQVLIDHLELF